MLPSLGGQSSLAPLPRCCGEINLPSLIVALELLVFLDALEFLFSRGLDVLVVLVFLDILEVLVLLEVLASNVHFQNRSAKKSICFP